MVEHLKIISLQQWYFRKDYSKNTNPSWTAMGSINTIKFNVESLISMKKSSVLQKIQYEETAELNEWKMCSDVAIANNDETKCFNYEATSENETVIEIEDY